MFLEVLQQEILSKTRKACLPSAETYSPTCMLRLLLLLLLLLLSSAIYFWGITHYSRSPTVSV